MPSEQSGDRTYRVFCAYGPLGREPGCGWERFAESEEQAERLVRAHSRDTHHADYERWDEPEVRTDGGRDEDADTVGQAEYEVYSCTVDGANEWYLAITASGPDLLVTPKGNLHESPAEESYAWLTDDEWTVSPVPVEDTPFSEVAR